MPPYEPELMPKWVHPFERGGQAHKAMRAKFAGRAMQAMLSREVSDRPGDMKHLARAAVQYADALIAELGEMK